MKRNRTIVSMIVMMALLSGICGSVTGCGGNGINVGENRAVSEGAVSGGAVSENAVRGESDEDANAKENQKTAATEARKYRFSTDTNLYYDGFDGERWDGKGTCYIAQTRLDGTHVKEILKIDEKSPYDDLQLHHVEKDWLYYEARLGDEDIMDDYIFYRVPIEKDAEGYDVVKISEKEELVRDYELLGLFCDESYVIYSDGEGAVVKYDLEKKEVVSAWEPSEFELAWDSEDFCIYRVNDYYVGITSEAGVYVQKMDDKDWNRCGGSDSHGWGEAYDTATQTENVLYYLCKDYVHEDSYLQIWKCDGERTECFISNNQIEETLKYALGLGKKEKPDVYEITEIYAQCGRVYMQIAVGWQDDSVYRMEYLLFSQGENENELRYEKELTEYMQSHVKTRTGKWGDWDEEEKSFAVVYLEHVIMNDAQCVYMMDGKMYLSLYDYENGKGRMGCYNLADGKFSWMTKKEAACGELARDGVYDKNGLKEVFRKDRRYNSFTDTDCWIVPTANKSRGADFYETKK